MMGTFQKNLLLSDPTWVQAGSPVHKRNQEVLFTSSTVALAERDILLPTGDAGKPTVWTQAQPSTLGQAEGEASKTKPKLRKDSN